MGTALEKDSDRLYGERVTHGVAYGGFQSVFTHERHTTIGDTLRSLCEGEGSLFVRQLIILSFFKKTTCLSR